MRSKSQTLNEKGALNAGSFVLAFLNQDMSKFTSAMDR